MFWSPKENQMQHTNYIETGKIISFDMTLSEFQQVKTIVFTDQAAMDEYMNDPDIIDKHVERDAYNIANGITKLSDDVEETI